MNDQIRAETQMKRDFRSVHRAGRALVFSILTGSLGAAQATDKELLIGVNDALTGPGAV